MRAWWKMKTKPSAPNPSKMMRETGIDQCDFRSDRQRLFVSYLGEPLIPRDDRDYRPEDAPCRHTPRCDSLFRHKMLMLTHGFVNAMEQQAAGAVVRQDDRIANNAGNHETAQKPVAVSQAASKEWQQKNQRQRAPRKHGRKN
jgi:hypothetical protein